MPIWSVNGLAVRQNLTTGTVNTWTHSAVSGTALIVAVGIRSNVTTHSMRVTHGPTVLNRITRTGAFISTGGPHFELYETKVASGAQTITVTGSRAWFDFSAISFNAPGIITGSYGVLALVPSQDTDNKLSSLTVQPRKLGSLLFGWGQSLQGQSHVGSITSAGWTGLGCGNGGGASGSAVAWVAAYQEVTNLSLKSMAVTWAASAGGKTMMMIEFMVPTTAPDPDEVLLNDNMQRIITRTRWN